LENRKLSHKIQMVTQILASNVRAPKKLENV
jgi:hypothetical protein